MLHLRSVALPALLLALCAAGLTACGSDSAGPKTLDRLAAVSISGAIGDDPKVTWKGQMSAGAVQAKTLVTGKGEALKSKDSALVQIWIGNGFSKKVAYSTHQGKAAKAELLTVNSQLPDFLSSLNGATIGSRIAITASADKAFGASGNPQLGIGNKDPVLIILDVVSGVLDAPSGDRTPYPSWMPKPTFADGLPSGFTFDGTPQPDGKLRRVQLLKGTGPRVEKGQTIAVSYLGETFGGTAPFDQNYTGKNKGPTTFAIGTGQVIKGWDQSLVGVPVGSRVVLEVPPDLGYADQAQSNIPANSTLIFVIDVLGVA